MRMYLNITILHQLPWISLNQARWAERRYGTAPNPLIPFCPLPPKFSQNLLVCWFRFGRPPLRGTDWPCPRLPRACAFLSFTPTYKKHWEKHSFMSRLSETEEESLGKRNNHTLVIAVPVITDWEKKLEESLEERGSNDAGKFSTSTPIDTKMSSNIFQIVWKFKR